MRRRARVIHLARRWLDPLILELKSKPTKEWPPHLNEAYKLLCKSDFSDKEIRSIVVRSISAAQACARKINRRSHDVVRYRAVGTLATLKLRKRLNEAVVPLILNKSVDPEIFDAIFDAVAKVFFEFPEEESAATALRYVSTQNKAISAIANASNKKIAVLDIFDVFWHRHSILASRKKYPLKSTP